ncbi:MAG: hypothetical protein ING75_05615 [Rhodocyclaceae bacterium]|nr:hypothetical protein [Rhodocyclaceae bacterium]
MSQFDRLDRLAIKVAKGNRDGVEVLSTGEAVYVALAANDAALLKDLNYTIAEAIARLGPDWTATLVERWQYLGDPALRE